MKPPASTARLTGGTSLQFYAGAGNDSFTGGSGGDVFIYTAADPTPADTLVGGACIDYLVVGGGALATTALDNVTGIEILYLGTGISATLNNDFVAGSSLGKMTVQATGGDTADASGVTNGIEVDFYAGGGNNTSRAAPAATSCSRRISSRPTTSTAAQATTTSS